MSFKSLDLPDTVSITPHVLDLTATVSGNQPQAYFTFTPPTDGFVVMHIELNSSARSNSISVRLTTPSANFVSNDPFSWFFQGSANGVVTGRTLVFKVTAGIPYTLDASAVYAIGTVYFLGSAVWFFLSA